MAITLWEFYDHFQENQKSSFIHYFKSMNASLKNALFNYQKRNKFFLWTRLVKKAKQRKLGKPSHRLCGKKIWKKNLSKKIYSLKISFSFFFLGWNWFLLENFPLFDSHESLNFFFLNKNCRVKKKCPQNIFGGRWEVWRWLWFFWPSGRAEKSPFWWWPFKCCFHELKLCEKC